MVMTMIGVMVILNDSGDGDDGDGGGDDDGDNDDGENLFLFNKCQQRDKIVEQFERGKECKMKLRNTFSGTKSFSCLD